MFASFIWEVQGDFWIQEWLDRETQMVSSEFIFPFRAAFPFITKWYSIVKMSYNLSIPSYGLFLI